MSLWVGPVVGALVLLAVLYPRFRLVLRLLPAALIAGSAIYVVWVQILHNYASVFEWPSYFHAVRIPVWVALVLVAADALDWRRMANRVRRPHGRNEDGPRGFERLTFESRHCLH